MTQLAKDPGRQHACRLLPRFIGMDIRMAGERLGNRLGLRKLRDAISDDYALPDSKLVTDALIWVREVSSPMLLNHCLRSHAFGAIVGKRCDIKVDREVFALTAIMHDVGLTPDYAEKPGSFEYVGAAAAHDFCCGHGLDHAKAAEVHNAIARHAAVGEAHKEGPATALIHFGAGADVLGIKLHDIPKPLLHEVLEAYPRLDFRQAFPALMEEQARIKPQGYTAGHMALGFGKKTRCAPIPER
ncbi:MAG: hypothetical protein AAF221_07750 [Pseudomonadota bacterium]